MGNPILDENGEPQKEVKNVKLEIRVNDTSVYSEEVNPLAESISVEFTNKGWVDIKVLIDGVRHSEDYLGIDLESKTVITID